MCVGDPGSGWGRSCRLESGARVDDDTDDVDDPEGPPIRGRYPYPPVAA